MRALLVGLHNRLSGHPDDALYPYPSSHTGGRIVALMQELDPTYSADDYMEDFDRMNLWKGRMLPQGWGSTAAYREEGKLLFEYVLDHHEDAVLFGARVWNAVTNRNAPSFFEVRFISETRFWYLPHPSGRNLIYNSAANREKAAEILLMLANRRQKNGT